MFQNLALDHDYHLGHDRVLDCILDSDPHISLEIYKCFKPFIAIVIFQGLEELQGFMIVNGVPNKDRQKLLRNLKVRVLK